MIVLTVSVQTFWYRAEDPKALGIIIRNRSNIFKAEVVSVPGD